MSLLPLDKKILKALAILEIKHQTTFVEEFLRDNFFGLGDDCKSIYLALVNRYKKDIPVGNYGGLYVGLRVLYQYLGIINEKRFIMGEQLQKRDLVNDKNSSKEASAQVVLFIPEGDKKLGNYFVNLADDIRKSWYQIGRGREKVRKLMKKPDDNIKRVMEFYWNKKEYTVDNSEIAVFDSIINEKNLMKWIDKFPSWKNHETDRTKSIHSTLKEYHNNKIVTTDDPRIVMSIVLKGRIEGRYVKVKNPSCTTKIFPRFWECLTE